MDRQMKDRLSDMLFFEDDEIYAEAKRRIEECGEKKSKKLKKFPLLLATVRLKTYSALTILLLK